MHLKALVERIVEPIRLQLVSPQVETLSLIPSGSAAIVPATWGDFPAEAELALLALTTRVIAKPLSVAKPVEYCGRVVTMKVLVDPQFYIALDPLFPLPLVALPDKFWNIYADFVECVDRYMRTTTSTVLSRHYKTKYGRRLMKRSWKLADRLVNIASPSLRRCEALYFSVRLRASLAGERAQLGWR